MLVGPSGSGKTTLISIVAAILEADEGQCELLGRNLRSMSEREKVLFRGDRIGFVFQGFNLLPALTALENVAVPLLLKRVRYADALKKARRLLDLVGLAGRECALPGQLSGGQQQRVAIARAVIHEPDLIVCDEPTSNLDHDTGREMMALLRDMVQRGGRSLVVVTHDPRIFSFADRIARMNDGEIIGVGAGAEEAHE